MAAASPVPLPSPAPSADGLPSVALEVRTGGGTSSYTVGDAGFLLGSVPGCDLRLSGTGLPPVVGLIERHPNAVRFRKLAPIGIVLLNNEPMGSETLRDGDHITVGSADITVRVQTAAPLLRVRLFDAAREDDRDSEFKEREQSLDEERAALAALRHELGEREAQLKQEKAELEKVQREMGEIRQQLYQRYRQRRDRLAGMQEALKRTARRIQERKLELEGMQERTGVPKEKVDTLEAELLARASELADRERQLRDQQELLAQRERQLEADHERRHADLKGRESKLDEERQALGRSQAQHQTDLVRLDRLAATLEQRQRQMQRNALDVDRRYEVLQRDIREVEEQASQLEEWHRTIKAEQDGFARQREELEAGRAEVAARAAALEGQQAMLASLRTRMEKLRDEYRKQEQQLDTQRNLQDMAEAEIQERLQAARQASQALEAERLLFEGERKQIEERRATLDTAVAQLRQAQTKIAEETDALARQRSELDARAGQQDEQEALYEARLRQVDQEREKLRKDRQVIDERQAALTRAEEVFRALQEQLRKRAEELAQRQVESDTRRQTLEQEQASFGEERQRVAAREQDLTTVQEQIQITKADLEEREAALRNEVQELLQGRERLEIERQQVADSRARLETEQLQASFLLHQKKSETEAAQKELVAIVERVAQVEQQSDEALRRLGLAREELRGHLAEVHDYVRQGRADLEALRDGMAGEQQRLHDQETALHASRDAHRLAVAAFRQQLSEWQAQLADVKQSLAQGETRLERRLAEVELRSQTLAVQAEQLEHQERQVVERRHEVDKHLIDMREWYRKKLRELARVDEQENAAASHAEPVAMIGGTIDVADEKLGQTLRSLELIDVETLDTLLGEAQRQRRSLRQLLLQGGYLTLFQLALIEAGNLDRLVLGPVRIIDRIALSPREAVYRVFDPRHGREAVLRHLAEAELQDAVRPDEFVQRFSAAASIHHDNLAATWEVLEIAGRPAVLQEWLTGLVSADWPALAAAPGVWYRLVLQAVQGLEALHSFGLVHGRLDANAVLVTGDGVVKLHSVGEPAWLTEANIGASGEPSEIDDLRALARCALAWSSPGLEKKASKVKPLPESLQKILQRWLGEGEAVEEPIQSAQQLLKILESARADVTNNPTAWGRLLQYVRENGCAYPLRRTA